MKRLALLVLLASCAPQIPELPPAPKVTLPPPGDIKPTCDTIPTIRFMPNWFDYNTHKVLRFTVNTIVNPLLTGGTRREQLSG